MGKSCSVTYEMRLCLFSFLSSLFWSMKRNWSVFMSLLVVVFCHQFKMCWQPNFAPVYADWRQCHCKQGGLLSSKNKPPFPKEMTVHEVKRYTLRESCKNCKFVHWLWKKYGDSFKARSRTALWSGNPTTGYIAKKTRNPAPPCVYCSSVDSSQDTESTKVFITTWVGEENVVYMHNGTLSCLRVE